MHKILIVTGSARPNSVNQAVTDFVKTELQQRSDVEVVIGDLPQLNLPFVDSAEVPSSDRFSTTHPSVQKWSQMVNEADGVVFVAPEYNHSLSAIQKNALDWLYNEWRGKPVAFIGYGWHAAKHSHAAFLAINDALKMNVGETYTGLQFMKDIHLDGEFADEAAVASQVKATLNELFAAIPQAATAAA